MEPLRLNILVVEDNNGDFLLIQDMLFAVRDFAKDVSHAGSLQDAIDCVQKQKIDVILLDLSLPDSYGIDSFTHLNQANPTVPILILSGLSDARFAHDAVKIGAQDYLVKGEFEEKLLAKSILYSIERKASMELLRQSQASYKLLFENNPIPMYIRNRDNYRIIKVNQSAVEHFGYTEEEMLRMRVKDLHPPEEQEYLHKVIEESKGISGRISVFRHVCKDGTVLVVECRSQEIILDGVPAMLILADDITEKRRVQEEALFLAGVLKNVRDIIFVTDVNGFITYWNEGAENTFGYTKEVVLNKSYELLYSEVDKTGLRLEGREIIQGNLEKWETRLISNEDEIVWVDVKASLLYDDKNQIVGIIRVCKDITENRMFSERQKETVAMLNSIFDNVNQSILLIDSDMRLKAFNSNAARHSIQLMGLELAENRPVSEYLLKDQTEEFRTKFQESLKGKEVQWEMAYRFSPGSVHWFSVNMSPVSDESGRVLGVCAGMLNITERKNADERFRGQFEEIEQNNRELDRLVKILSHDLKAPMNSVSGLITLARDEKNPDEFVNYLNMMEKSLRKLETFTNDIISSLKNRGKTADAELNLYQLIQEIIEELRFAPGAERMKFVNAVRHELNLNSDKALLRSIFSNLISNAIKYSDETKQDSFVEVSCSEFPLIVEIRVRDNGIGISDEHHARIFETYYTVEKRPDSNGLGLSNVKDAVFKLNGTIDFESKSGEGTTFRIQLPVSK
jgi:PAS domain S-box-containing protein